MSYSFGKSMATDGLVFYVDAANSLSYPGSGTTWTDLAGSNDGTLTNGPTFDSGNGGSIVFDGTNDRVDIDYTPKGQSSITICSWFKTTETSRMSLVGCYSGYDATNSNSFAINLNRGSALEEQDSIYYFARIGTGFANTQASYITNTSLTDGNWHFLAVTHSLSTGAVVMNLDGTSYTVTDVTNSSSGPWGAHEYKPYIGANNAEGTANVFFDGEVACMSVYDRVLSADEITQNYEALKGRFT